MPVVLAFLATALFLAAPTVVVAHDLEPTSTSPDVVVIIDASLSRREVRVSAGSVVGWVNRDDERHRIRSRSGPAEFDSGNLDTVKRFAVLPAEFSVDDGGVTPNMKIRRKVVAERFADVVASLYDDDEPVE